MNISEILFKEFKVSPTLSEFVLWTQEFNEIELNTEKAYWLIVNYNDFLKQPIELKMLVPCRDGEVLEEPKEEDLSPIGERKTSEQFTYYNRVKEYQKAKEDVIFDFEVTESSYRNIYSLHNKETGKFFDTLDNKKDKYFLTRNGFPKVEKLTGQPITENYFKFLD